MSVFFNGRLIVSPATASVVDSSRLYSRGLSVGNILALVGTCEGGQPGTALQFSSAAQAKEVLLSGDLLRAVQMAFDPSSETGAPASVTCIRVNPATQATLTLLDGASGNAIVLYSTNYGQSQNQIKVKVEAGTNQGLKLTTQLGPAYYCVDDMQRRAFSLTYGGAEAGAVTATVGNSTMTLNIGSTPTAIALANYPSVQALVDYLNTVGGITAAVLDGNGLKPSVNGLDAVTAVNIKATDATITGTLQAAVDWFNSSGEGFITAARATGATRVPTPVGFTYLSGGGNGSVTNNDWSNAFTALQTEDVQWVVPLTGTSAIHAMADAHVAFMSKVMGKERRSICGTDLATPDANAITAAKALNSDRTSLTHLGVYDYDDSAALVLYPPCFAAVLVAAGFCGLNPGTPMTNHSLKVRGLERKLRNPTDTDALILGGVLCLEDTAAGYKVVQSVSTWLNDRNYDKVEQSVGVALDFTMRNLRKALDVLRGKKNDPRLLNLAVEIADTQLKALSKPEPEGPGVLAGDKDSPPFKGLTASIVADQLLLSFQASPVLPNNYVLVTCYAVPFSGTASI